METLELLQFILDYAPVMLFGFIGGANFRNYELTGRECLLFGVVGVLITIRM